MPKSRSNEVDRFIEDRISSVPHLEALLLLWRERPKSWSAETLTERLWVKSDTANGILLDLARDGLITAVPGSKEFRYEPDPERDELLNRLSDQYRKDLIRISTMIHSKASSAVREFARSFEIKKRQE